MKNVFALAALFIFTQTSFAQDSLTFNQLIIKKNINDSSSIFLSSNRSVTTWCTGFASPVSFGGFEAAQTIEGLNDGLYSCEGKFVQISGERRNVVQIFEIGSCSPLKEVELKTQCPPKPNRQ